MSQTLAINAEYRRLAARASDSMAQDGDMMACYALLGI